MSGRKGKSKASFPIPTLQLARNLIYIYARLKGEIAKADDREEMMIPFVQVKEYMRFIQHLMPLLSDCAEAAKTSRSNWQWIRSSC